VAPVTVFQLTEIDCPPVADALSPAGAAGMVITEAIDVNAELPPASLALTL